MRETRALESRSKHVAANSFRVKCLKAQGDLTRRPDEDWGERPDYLKWHTTHLRLLDKLTYDCRDRRTEN